MGELAALELRVQCLIFFLFSFANIQSFFCYEKKAWEKQQINETEDKAKAAKIKNL